MSSTHNLRPQRLQVTTDRLDILEIVNSIASAVDRGECEEVLQYLSEDGISWTWEEDGEVYLNDLSYSSHGTPEEFIERLRHADGWDHNLHHLGTHTIAVNGDEATCRCTFHLAHVLTGADRRECFVEVGDIEHHLVRTKQGWKLDAYVINFIAEFGNPDLLQIAADRGPKINSQH